MPVLVEIITGVLFAVIILVGGVLLRGRRRRCLDVRGISVELSLDGRLLSVIRAPLRWADAFRFAVRDEGAHSRLSYPPSGDQVFVVRRDRKPGQFRVVTAAGEELVVGAGDPGFNMGGGLRLAMTDRPA